VGSVISIAFLTDLKDGPQRPAPVSGKSRKEPEFHSNRSFDRQVWHGCHPGEMTMRWEYRTVDWGEIRKIGSRITGEDFIDANVDAGLNFLGEEGWELVTVYVDGYTTHRSSKGEELLASSRYVKYTFKRPVD
jgi:hypothetical protein